MYAPHTVTLYNVVQETDTGTFQDVEKLYVTILRGVFLEATKAVNVRESGLESADAVNERGRRDNLFRQGRVCDGQCIRRAGT